MFWYNVLDTFFCLILVLIKEFLCFLLDMQYLLEVVRDVFFSSLLA